MQKKNYVSPMAEVIKLETSAMICGSGTESIVTSISNGSSIDDGTSGSTPTPVTQDGFTGIFGEAKAIGDFRFDN